MPDGGSARWSNVDRASDLLARWRRGTMTTRGSPPTWLTLVRGPLPLWSYWEEKLAADGGPAESLRHTAGLQTAVFRNVSAAECAFP